MDDILRELLEHKIYALDKRIDDRFCSRDKELVKQATEYERRLSDLNGEQSRLRSDRERYMPREIADQRQKDFEDWRLRIENTMAASAGRNTIIMVILSAAISSAIFAISKVVG